jgi:pimeloyl-ACP methyl ester carboxylesterase
MSGIARAVLATAPNRFALCGLSMGGSIAFEMMRQAPDRIERLALLDTSALSDTPEQTEWRLQLIAMAQTGGGTARLDRSVDFLGKSTLDLVNRAAIDSNRLPESLQMDTIA